MKTKHNLSNYMECSKAVLDFFFLRKKIKSNSKVFRKFFEVCTFIKFHHDLILGCFGHPRKKPCTCSQSLFIHPLPWLPNPPPGNHKSTLCFYRPFQTLQSKFINHARKTLIYPVWLWETNIGFVISKYQIQFSEDEYTTQNKSKRSAIDSSVQHSNRWRKILGHSSIMGIQVQILKWTTSKGIIYLDASGSPPPFFEQTYQYHYL